MKAIFISILLLFFITVTMSQNLNGLLNTVTNVFSKDSLSDDDINSGLKEALQLGTKNSVDTASKTDGFFKNPSIKILFPSEAKAMEVKLRSIGMNKQCDKFIESLNRGAEEASKYAFPIFLNEITNLSITDGLRILNGSDNAATEFLKEKTRASLRITFLPIVKNALEKVEITKYWNPLMKSYNRIPTVKKINPDLDAYVTEKAMDGLFLLIANEELKIRKDPVARVSDILKKVFGAQ